MAMLFTYTYLVLHMRIAVLSWIEGLSIPVSDYCTWTVMNTLKLREFKSE